MVLAVAKERPGEAGEEIGARPFQRDPEGGRGPCPEQAAPVGGRCQDGAERSNVQRAIACQQQHDEEAHGVGHLAVLVHGVDHPVQGHGKKHQARQPALSEGRLPGRPADREQERHQADPGQRFDVEDGKAQGQQETGRDGQDEKRDEARQHRVEHSRFAANETTAADELSGCDGCARVVESPPAKNG